MLRRELLALAALVVFFVSVALAGLDYGDQHWDEPTNVKNVVWALQNRAPFPHYYFYPTGMSWVLAAAAVPEMLAGGIDGAPALMMDKPYRLRARTFMIVLSALCLVGTWALARAQRRGPFESWAAAGLVATSWSFVSHARFLATDALNVAVSVCAAAAISIAAHRRSIPWLRTAALGVGLAASTKWVPGVLVVPLLFEAARVVPPHERIREIARLLAIVALTLLVVTPGLVFEPGWVLRGLQFQSAVYRSGWIGYSVAGPLELFGALGGWLLFAASSPWTVGSAALLLCAVVGAWDLARDRAVSRVVWLFLPLFVLPFLLQHVFIARNVLMVVPFLALLAARGVTRMAVRAPRVGVGLVAAVIVSHAVFVVHAAQTIRAHETTARDQTAAFLAAHPDEDFLASPTVRGWFPDRAHLMERATPTTNRLLALPGELFTEETWPANDPFLVQQVLGPLEVDFRYLPSWRGPPRVVLVALDRAQDAGASLQFAPTGPAPPQSPMHLIAR